MPRSGRTQRRFAALAAATTVRIPCVFDRALGKIYATPHTLGHASSSAVLLEVDNIEHAKVRSNGNSYGDLHRQTMVYCDQINASVVLSNDISCHIGNQWDRR